MKRICCFWCALVLSAAVGRAGDRETAKEAIVRIQKEAARPDHEGFRELFTKDAFGRAREDEAEKQRLALAEFLQGYVITDVREKGDEAAAAFRPRDEVTQGVEREILMRREGEQWRLAGARTYTPTTTPGKTARVRLTMRTTNGPYGTSAYCFTYVTGDPTLCKNRMDIWFCHNGDLHATKDGRIATVGIIALKNLTRVPLGLEWTRDIRARPSYTYIVHCRDARDRDFFVKLKVAKLKRGVVELEWALLTGGFGAPRDVAEAQPLLSNDGADGYDGLCGRNR